MPHWCAIQQQRHTVYHTVVWRHTGATHRHASLLAPYSHTTPYSTIQRCMSIQPYSTIHHTAHTAPLRHQNARLARGLHKNARLARVLPNLLSSRLCPCCGLRPSTGWQPSFFRLRVRFFLHPVSDLPRARRRRGVGPRPSSALPLLVHPCGQAVWPAHPPGSQAVGDPC